MERPWIRHYDPGVPATLAPYPETTLLDSVAEAARERPEHPALLFKGARLGYGELERLSTAFGGGLSRLGVRKGDRVALLLPNCPQFLMAELGAWKAGATVVPLNPMYTGAELVHPLADTGAETLVVLSLFYERAKSIQAQTGVKRVIATSIKEYLPPLLRLLFTLFKERKEGHRVALEAGDLWFGDVLGSGPGPAPPLEPTRAEETALILMSGGTTGTPKGVVCSHRGLALTGMQARAWIRPVLPDWGGILMLPLPLFHAAAGILGLGACVFGHNTLLLVPNPRDIDDLLETIRRERPTFFAGVPALFNALLNHPKVKSGSADFRSIRLCFSGAAPLLAETKRRFEELTGGRIVEAYSLTEALVAPIVNPVLGVNKLGSVGMPAPDVEVRIVDSETGQRDLPAGEVGEIALRAPQMMPGYWRSPEETALALRDHGAAGRWLHTADLGYLDEDGYLFIVDRMKDLIKPGGFQVWPREIEEVIALHPAVAEVGVAGVPDPVRGEVAKAWIVLRPEASTTAEEIRAHCKERLAPYKVPTLVEFRKDLPKSMVGKVLRRVLVAEHRTSAA